MTSLIVTVAIVLVAYFVVGPIVVGRKLRFAAVPEIEDVAPDDPRFPEAVRAFHQDVADELAPLGFTPAAYLINADAHASTTTYTAVLQRPHSRDLASATTVHPSRAPQS